MPRLFRRAVPAPAQRPPRLARPSVPPATVLFRPDVLTTIAAAAAAAGERETGGPLIGTVQPSWEPAGRRLIVSVLGAVPPGPGTRGRTHSVALGASHEGERAASAVRWLRAESGLDLVHLGDWHKHPSGSPYPSRGDVATACRMLAETEASVWLAAIAVGEERREEDVETNGNVASVSTVEVSCEEIRLFRAVGRADLARIPIRVEGDVLPRLPALPWHVADPMRFAAECRLLDAAGFKTALGPGEGGGGLVLRVSRNGHALDLVTGDRYPRRAPRIRDGNGRRFDSRGWCPDRFLVDVVKEVWK